MLKHVSSIAIAATLTGVEEYAYSSCLTCSGGQTHSVELVSIVFLVLWACVTAARFLWDKYRGGS